MSETPSAIVLARMSAGLVRRGADVALVDRLRR